MELLAARTHAARSHATTNSWTLRGGWGNSYFKGFASKWLIDIIVCKKLERKKSKAKKLRALIYGKTKYRCSLI